jgi:hypothetical protein
MGFRDDAGGLALTLLLSHRVIPAKAGISVSVARKEKLRFLPSLE